MTLTSRRFDLASVLSIVGFHDCCSFICLKIHIYFVDLTGRCHNSAGYIRLQIVRGGTSLQKGTETYVWVKRNGKIYCRYSRSIVAIESLRTPISQLVRFFWSRIRYPHRLCQDNGANKRSFNDGYHAIHHLNVGKCRVGWSAGEDSEGKTCAHTLRMCKRWPCFG